MGNRYHVKSATMSLGSTEYEMATGPAAKSQTREALEVTALADTFKQFIPGALTEDDEFTVTIYDKGPTARPAVSDSPATLSFTVSLSNGGGSSGDVTASFAYQKVIVTKIAAPNQDGAGDRKATIDVTFRPTGEQASSQGS